MMQQEESPMTSPKEDPLPIETTRDYYLILEVPLLAPQEQIGGSYNRIYNRLLSLQHSAPQDVATAAKFKELAEAYNTLSDPVKRRAYDKRNQAVAVTPPSMVNRAFGAIVSRFGPGSNVSHTSGMSDLATLSGWGYSKGKRASVRVRVRTGVRIFFE
jgi:curved DNA-binding protein CbpA